MIEVLAELSAHERQRLADALEAGFLVSPYSEVSLRSAGIQESVAAVASALTHLDQSGGSPMTTIAWLRILDQTARQAPSTDLVWSGPEVPGLHARDTRRVYDELLGTAQRSVWASTYVFFDGPRAFEVLAKRMDSTSGLQVTLLINIQRKRGDTTVPDHLVRQFADRFWETDWPGTARPAVFYDPRALDLDKPGGVLHAKAVVTDEELVFVTSANLTGAALDRNIELGLLVRDRALAKSIVSHFAMLIEVGQLTPLPGG